MMMNSNSSKSQSWGAAGGVAPLYLAPRWDKGSTYLKALNGKGLYNLYNL